MKLSVGIAYYLCSLTMICSSISCSNKEPHRVLARLDAELAVNSAKLTVRDCKLNSIPLNSPSPIPAKPGESLELTGTMAPGEWDTAGIMNPEIERTNRAIAPGARHLVVGLHVYGDDVKTNNGILHAMMVEVQPLKEASDFQFRAKFKAPQHSGNYVVDLHVQDSSNETRKRGDPPNKSSGVAIWRRELSVK